MNASYRYVTRTLPALLYHSFLPSVSIKVQLFSDAPDDVYRMAVIGRTLLKKRYNMSSGQLHQHMTQRQGKLETVINLFVLKKAWAFLILNTPLQQSLSVHSQ